MIRDMNIVSLFDGMACGMLAMQGTGVTVDNYWAYEIDKYAIQTATHNFPNIVECGDVFEADFTQYKDIDFLIGGSPCTYWSIAQKNNRETEASGMGWELFSQYVRALRDIKPKYFIYENNKSMAKVIRQSITETFGFDAICINSALVSAQNRQRLYWVGKRNDDGTYSKVNIEQPEDREILLRDILDRGEPVNITKDDKSQTLKAQYQNSSMSNICCYKSTYGASDIAEYVRVNKPSQVGAMPRPNGELSTSQGFRIYDINSKSVTLKGNAGGAGGKTGLYAVPIESDKDNSIPIYVGEMPNHKGQYRNGNQCSQQYRVYSIDGKSICCSTDSRNNVAIPVEFDGDTPTKAISGADGKTYTVYSVTGGQITIKGKTYPIKLSDGYYIIRKLTVSECKRLQTVPEWYEFPVSNAQAYKMLGNGWTVDVIVHLIKGCLNA